MSSRNLTSTPDQTGHYLEVDVSASDLGRRAHQELVNVDSDISAFERSRPSDFYHAEREKFVGSEIGAQELHNRVVEYWGIA